MKIFDPEEQSEKTGVCSTCNPDTSELDAYRNEWQWLFPDVKIHHKWEQLEDGCYGQCLPCPHMKEHFIKIAPGDTINNSFGFECPRDRELDYLHEMLHYGRNASEPCAEDRGAYLMWEQDIEQTARWLLKLKRERDAALGDI